MHNGCIFGRKMSLARASKHLKEQNGQKGKPFSTTRALNKVFEAPKEMHAAARKQVAHSPSRPHLRFQDRVFGLIRLWQTT
jgi:hypothetical protein